MSATNGSLKRNNEELEVEDVSENSSEPESKQIKINPSISQHNLESAPTKSDATNECETSTESVVEELKSVPCSINIKFHDDVIADLYKSKFLKFISSFAEFEVRNANNLTIDIYRNERVNDSDEELGCNKLSSSAKKRKKHSKVKKELFVVDATPSQNTLQSELRYTTKFTINTGKNADENVSLSSKQTCFNCSEYHALKDCPHPKDYAKINAARQKFKFQGKSSRYHLEEDKRFSHLEPGKISGELRKALGLHRNEAPRYVYLMRQLGYPPGWLEEAKFVHSNLDMFDIHGNFVKSAASAKKRGLDENRIVEYPGFNVPFQKGVKDDHRMYRVPPYSENFSKNAMICFFDKKFAQEEDNFETCDMEIDHEPDVSDVKQEKEIEIKINPDRKSPTLTDLELQKRQLLEQLNDEPKVVKKEESDQLSDKSFLTVKTSCFGTPLIKSNSPYSTLPNPDNFSKDVSPVIHFENLPNSTGKYEQLSDVLQKVRSTLKKEQNCNT